MIESQSQPIIRRDDNVSRWVCFYLNQQIYGLPILDVQEVLSQFDIEPVPGTDPQVLGVINLRGTVVTVLDLRRRLGAEVTEVNDTSRVIIIDHGAERFGLLVDHVADVRKVVDGAIKPAPEMGLAAGSVKYRGIYNKDREMLTLLDAASLIEGASFVVAPGA